jgi:pantetheine-phosphate adenylyltransferase
MATALFPGTFNPFTVGHQSIVERALKMFDKIIIAVGYNENKAESESAASDRVKAIAEVFAGNPKVEVCSYSTLTAKFAAEKGATVLLRGVRSIADFEYERTLADTNRMIASLETVLLYTLPEHSAISSSMVRELNHFGYDTSSFIARKSEAK